MKVIRKHLASSRDALGLAHFRVGFVNQLLRVRKASPALGLATERRIRRVRATRTALRDTAYFFLANGIADADDHGSDIALLRHVRK